ncbi:MAG: cytochrome b [Pseudomonadota bacterium]
MSAMNSETAWGWPARVLHWVMALMIVILLVVGIYMSNFIPDTLEGIGQRVELTQMHKSFGFTVFVLAVLRVVWRLANPTPKLPDAMPGWQKAASHASHFALYGLIFIMPLTGWLMASASPLNNADAYPTQIKNMVFGLFEMPDPFPTGTESLESIFHTAHFLSSLGLVLILGLHIGAALKHHLVDRDAILRRMVSGRGE